MPALSLTEPEQFEAPTLARSRRSRPSTTTRTITSRRDEFDRAWDFSGAANDMKLLATLAWRIAADPAMPAYNDGDQFAQIRKK